MMHIKIRVLTLQVILSLIFLNTQTSFAQNLNKWSEGPYGGVSLVFNKIKEGDAFYKRSGTSDTPFYYTSDREKSKGIKIGYNKMLTDSIFLGPEFFYSGEKSLDFNDAGNGGVIDNIRFKKNYNIGLRAGYAVSSDIAYVIGYGKSYQKVETSFVDSRGDADIENYNVHGFYRNFGILFNLDNGYNLEFSHQINSIDSTFHTVGPVRGGLDITIKDVKSTSVTISKFF
jgi:hypothetical protein